jgi:hypothetical protein
MIFADPTGSRPIRGIAILSVLLLLLFQAIRRNPRDRVLIFQTIAFGLALFMGALGVLGEMPDWLFPIMATLFCCFVILAGYFGLQNWLRRRKRAG